MRTLGWFLLLILLRSELILAADWPQYRGPRRDDVSDEKDLLAAWPKDGPFLLWTYSETGIGYSGSAIVGDRLFTIGGRGESEFLIALNLRDIKDQSMSQAWATRVGPTFDWKGNSWSAGPSLTPTVDGDLIFALGGNGHLICVHLDAADRLRPPFVSARSKTAVLFQRASQLTRSVSEGERFTTPHIPKSCEALALADASD